MGQGCLHWQIHYKEVAAKCVLPQIPVVIRSFSYNTHKIKLLLNVPVPKHKVYIEKYLYYIFQHTLMFAMSISKRL